MRYRLSAYLFSYFTSKHGQNAILRNSVGTVQPKLSIERIKKFEIPDLNRVLQEEIQTTVDLGYAKIVESKKSYKQAEELLLQTLGLHNFSPSQAPTNIKSFAQSFGSSGRLDAEYYQPKYADYYNLLTSFEGGFSLFSEACKLKDKNFKPEDKKQYKYIELSNIGRSGEITGTTVDNGENLPARARRKITTNDIIISSIESSLDFKSKPMQVLLKKACSGTILTAIGKAELERIPIPLIPPKIQEEIKNQVDKSFKLRKQSEHLLKIAKRAVEMAIEADEHRRSSS